MKRYTINAQEGCVTGSGFSNTKYLKYQLPLQTSGSLSNNYIYSVKLPTNIDVFSKLFNAISSLSNATVKSNSVQLINLISHSLSKAYEIGRISNYLSRLNITEQEDLSALIEWNFEDFRVGFSIEADEKESSYFLISQDRELGEYSADTKKISDNAESVIGSLVNYVLENT